MDDFDNFQRNRKIFIYLGIFVLVVLILLIFVFLNFKNFFSSGDYLIVSNHLIFKSDDKWVQVTPNDIKNSKFTVYNGLNKINATKISYENGQWNFYDGNKLLDVDDFRFAYSGNIKINALDYYLEEYDSTDEKLILDVVNSESEEDLELYRRSLRKVNTDFDGDGSLETIYVTSDFIFGNGYRTPYSYMFLTKDGDVVDSIFDIDNNVYNIVNVIDMNDDGLYEIIVSKGAMPSEDFNSCYQIYNVVSGNIKLVQDCDK